jgi:NADH-quinone oxidoreductase subunit M
VNDGNLLPLLLIAFPAAGVLALLALPGALGDRVAARLGLVVTAATLGVAMVMAMRFERGSAARMQFESDHEWVPALGMRWHLGVDGVSLPLIVLTAALTFLCLVHTMRSVPDPGRPRAFVGVLLLLEVGMLGSFVVLDLLVFFVFFEIVLLPMWWLIAVWGDGSARPAANRFILYTLLGSAFMLIGFLIVWAHTDTLDMVELATRHGGGMSHRVQVLAFAAMLAGFAVKTPMWPLHTWLPGAHTAAPTVGSVLLAGVLLKMGTYGLVRTALPVTPEGAEELAPYLGVLAVAGIVYGSLACLGQRDLKRLIAYSSVGHMGFVLLGIATLSPAGINGALYGNVAHGLITGLLFFLVGSLKARYATVDLDRLGGGIYGRAPRLGALLAFAAVASLGLPGLAGFWGEFLAMTGAFRPAEALDRGLFLTLMAVAGIGTVLTAAYLLVMVRRVCMGPGPEGLPAGPRGGIGLVDAVTWAPLVLAVVVLGFWPRALLAVTDPAVRVLLGGG